jgi:hypothetical protein
MGNLTSFTKPEINSISRYPPPKKAMKGLTG